MVLASPPIVHPDCEPPHTVLSQILNLFPQNVLPNLPEVTHPPRIVDRCKTPDLLRILTFARMRDMTYDVGPGLRGPGLRVLQTPAHATVQDHGRRGYRGVGVPVGGAFDASAHGWANALVGNDPTAATLELALWGGRFLTTGPLDLAWCGAWSPVTVSLNGSSRTAYPLGPRAVWVPEGAELHIGAAVSGARLYLAVRGGWRTDPVLGSRSSSLRITAGDGIPAEASPTPRYARSPAFGTFPTPETDGKPVTVILDILPGPDWPVERDWPPLPEFAFPDAVVTAQHNRMGYQLEPATPFSWPTPPERLSAPVAPGALQWTGRRLLLLGPDAGTMGGYPHLAHVVTRHIPALAQARTGDILRFRPVSLQDARVADDLAALSERRTLDRIRTRCQDGLRA